MERKPKAYVKKSTISGLGKGLFAAQKIKKGEIIAKFEGKLIRPDDIVPNGANGVHFNDGYVLACFKDDLASYAKDCISIQKRQRELVKALESNEPFYKKHEKAKLNAEIKLNEMRNTHIAYLASNQNIDKDEEIFIHYGFPYWFLQEASQKGFMCEKIVEEKGMPLNYYDYPGFSSYIKEFYPESTDYNVKQEKYNPDKMICTINCKNGEFIGIPLPNFSKLFRRFDLDENKFTPMKFQN
jgi:hypothetical protein